MRIYIPSPDHLSLCLNLSIRNFSPRIEERMSLKAVHALLGRSANLTPQRPKSSSITVGAKVFQIRLLNLLVPSSLKVSFSCRSACHATDVLLTRRRRSYAKLYWARFPQALAFSLLDISRTCNPSFKGLPTRQTHPNYVPCDETILPFISLRRLLSCADGTIRLFFSHGEDPSSTGTMSSHSQ
jgi:hypothetical protein